MTKEINQQLYPYLFPVEEKQVYIPHESKFVPAERYKAVVRSDNNRLISIQKDSYQLIENSAIIYPLLEQLDSLNTAYYFDQSHSFVMDSRMSLTVLFPEINLFDGKKEWVNKTVNPEKLVSSYYLDWLREQDSNLQPSG